MGEKGKKDMDLVTKKRRRLKIQKKKKKKKQVQTRIIEKIMNKQSGNTSGR